MTGKAQHKLKIEKWSEIVQARKSSGLTISQWCHENGINEKSYYRWQRIITRENADSVEVDRLAFKNCKFETAVCNF